MGCHAGWAVRIRHIFSGKELGLTKFARPNRLRHQVSVQGGPSNGAAHGVDFERGPGLKQELAAFRKIKTHLAEIDRPDNYVAYAAEHWDQQGQT